MFLPINGSFSSGRKMFLKKNMVQPALQVLGVGLKESKRIFCFLSGIVRKKNIKKISLKNRFSYVMASLKGGIHIYNIPKVIQSGLRLINPKNLLPFFLALGPKSVSCH